MNKYLYVHVCMNDAMIRSNMQLVCKRQLFIHHIKHSLAKRASFEVFGSVFDIGEEKNFIAYSMGRTLGIMDLLPSKYCDETISQHEAGTI